MFFQTFLISSTSGQDGQSGQIGSHLSNQVNRGLSLHMNWPEIVAHGVIYLS